MMIIMMMMILILTDDGDVLVMMMMMMTHLVGANDTRWHQYALIAFDDGNIIQLFNRTRSSWYV